MVYQDIFESPYSFEYKNFRLYFSSIFNKNRFVNRIDEFIKDENLKNINKYNVKIDLTNYLIVVLYKKIEKRGFRVYNNNELIQDNEFKI